MYGKREILKLLNKIELEAVMGMMLVVGVVEGVEGMKK